MWDLQNFIVEELQTIGFANAQSLRTINDKIIPRNQNENDQDWRNRDNLVRGQKSEGFDLFIQLHSDGIDPVPNATDHATAIYPMDGRNNTQALGQSICDAIKSTMELNGTSSIRTAVTDAGNDERFFVMKGARSVNCPRYFIVENSFHSNSRAAHWLMQNSNLRRLARAYAEVIRAHFS
jgi:N-acetylmuramoyl-L-alanine amidase